MTIESISENEGFSSEYRTQRPERGVEDVFVACTDNLTSFNANHIFFSKDRVQKDMIHQSVLPASGYSTRT